MLVGMLGQSASAQDFELQLDSEASVALVDASTAIETSGFLIGDYDPDTNPEGTQTRPGFFGGSGNQPINTITTLNTTTSLDTMPAGSMTVSLDALGGSAEIDGLMLDLLNGSDAGTGLSITFGFDTFHTVSPGFIYPGGIPITIPLGDIAQLSQAVITQTGPALVTLTPADLPEAYELIGVVPAALDLTVILSLPGGTPTETPLSQVPVLLPVSGTLELHGGDHLTLMLSTSPDPISTLVPIEGVDLPTIPFELPTLGSETAGVLFTLSPQSISLDATIAISINASGNASACAADLNNDGALNFFDISAFLSAFTAMDPAADFSGDGMFNFFDVSGFLAAFSSGCP